MKLSHGTAVPGLPVLCTWVPHPRLPGRELPLSWGSGKSPGPWCPQGAMCGFLYASLSLQTSVFSVLE